MKHLIFTLNYFFAGCSFAFLVGGEWIVGGLFTLAYVFVYWLAITPDEPPDADENNQP